MTTLDTRQKIRAGEAIPNLGEAFPSAWFVVGSVDPLTAAHARRLAQLASRGTLVLLLADPPDPLLPAAARAELAAALQCVAAVVTGVPESRLAEIPADRLVREESADLERRAVIIDGVHRRHSAAATQPSS